MNKRADLYDADELYSFIEGVATEHDMKQTLIALPLMKELHKGQFRSGKDKKPYICNHEQQIKTIGSSSRRTTTSVKLLPIFSSIKPHHT